MGMKKKMIFNVSQNKNNIYHVPFNIEIRELRNSLPIILDTSNRNNIYTTKHIIIYQ